MGEPVNKSPLPNTRAFRLIWQVAPFLDWLFRSIRWRAKACWYIARWIVAGSPSLRHSVFNDYGKIIQSAWRTHNPDDPLYCFGECFYEEMPVVIGYKDSSIEPELVLCKPVEIETAREIIKDPIKLRTTHELRPVAMCTDGKIRPIEEIK